MIDYNLAIIGFGNVGQGLAEILAQGAATIRKKHGVDIRVVAVCDLTRGSIADPNGLDPKTLLDQINSTGHLGPCAAPANGWSAHETIEKSGASVLVELSYTDLKTGEPVLSHITHALESGMDVVTTNKGPAALHFSNVMNLSRRHGRRLGTEGTVMSGTPALSLGAKMLVPAGITRIQGILNGTTNYMLGEMEKGLSYSDALEKAQANGYAEADPTGDVDGYDAAAKIVILANLVMNQSMTMHDVSRIGISELTREDIQSAKERGQRWKLIGTLEYMHGRIFVSLKPTLLDTSHSLYGIDGSYNVITFGTELLGNITLVGPGAGRMETGYAIISDILAFGR